MSSGWIVGLGEVLWDVFPDGAVFGGAPANFACHASALGASVAMVSAIGTFAGTDDLSPTQLLSKHALKILQERGVDTRAVQSTAYDIGTVVVEVDEHGKPTYTFSQDPAWDFIQWDDSIAQVAAQARAVCFGTLAQRAPLSRGTIQRFLREVSPATLRVFDVNLRLDYWSEATITESLAQADILKLNDDELPIVARACGLELTSASGAAELHVLEQLIERYKLQVVALTRGSEGATLMTRDAVDHCPAPATTVRDTVGAGDAYTAALIIGLQKGWSLAKVNQQAVRLAAYVCTQPGATPKLPLEISSVFTAD